MALTLPVTPYEGTVSYNDTDVVGVITASGPSSTDPTDPWHEVTFMVTEPNDYGFAVGSQFYTYTDMVTAVPDTATLSD